MTCSGCCPEKRGQLRRPPDRVAKAAPSQVSSTNRVGGRLLSAGATASPQASMRTSGAARSSALAVLPTGGGKSLCYQIPALVRPGLGLVVSPLIAVMADQVSALQLSGVAAEKLDSNTSLDTRGDIWRRIDQGKLDLLCLSPEGLLQPSMLERLSHLPLALVAIDEAHCVSQWGHDFRPEYRMLGQLATGECFRFVQGWVEKKVRRHMMKARKRQGFGWTRWSRQWLYDTLKLFNGYKVRWPQPKVAPAG